MANFNKASELYFRTVCSVFFDALAKEFADFSFNFQFLFDTEERSVNVDFATGSM